MIKRVVHGLLLLIGIALLMIPVYANDLDADEGMVYKGVAPWFEEGIEGADAWGLIPESFEAVMMDAPITRGEFAEAAVRTYLSVKGELPDAVQKGQFADDANLFADAATMLGIVSGYPDGGFHSNDPITRQEMFVMIENLLKASVDSESEAILSARTETPKEEIAQKLDIRFSDVAEISDWALSASYTVTDLGLVSGTDLGALDPTATASRSQALVILYGVASGIAETPELFDSWVVLLSDTNVMTEEVADFKPVSRGGYRRSQDDEDHFDPLKQIGTNSEKYALIFGSSSAVRYQTADEAAAHMVTITIPVWKVDANGEKYTSSQTLDIHEAIADTVFLIFEEIYEGPEAFPIKDVGGYAWRSNTDSEHRWGLAIDINANENCMINSSGNVVAGSFWMPGENIYSILPDGDVVTTFKKYGFAWGGDAWPSNKDYMHFSFLGK